MFNAFETQPELEPVKQQGEFLLSVHKVSKYYLDRLTPQRAKKHMQYQSKEWEIGQYKLLDNPFEYPHSPNLWHNGHKKNDNAFAITGMIIDIDDPQIRDMASTKALLIASGRAFAIMTTPNHMVAKANGIVCERYRIFLPFDKIIDLDDSNKEYYKENALDEVSRYPEFNGLVYDKTSFEVHRFFMRGYNVETYDGWYTPAVTIIKRKMTLTHALNILLAPTINTTASEQELIDMISCIPEKGIGYDDWWPIYNYVMNKYSARVLIESGWMDTTTKPAKGTKITIGTIKHLARQYGYKG